MRRRDFLSAIGALALTPTAQAQQGKSTLRVAYVSMVPRSMPLFEVFPRRMAELGYKVGENVTYDVEFFSGTEESIYAAMRELVAGKPDIICAFGPEAPLKAALAYSETTPIVMFAVDYDPLAKGYVSSLARPGGRITGLYLQQTELAVKRLQVFKEAFPDLGAAVVFYDKPSLDQWTTVQAASRDFDVRLFGVDLREPPYDYDGAIAAAPTDYRKYLFGLMSPVLWGDRERLIQFALRHRIASIFGTREFVEAGGLMSYGADFVKLFARMADITAQVARGARPSELPIEQPTHFDFIVNLATARTLGLEMPQAVLARADEVIE